MYVRVCECVYELCTAYIIYLLLVICSNSREVMAVSYFLKPGL